MISAQRFRLSLLVVFSLLLPVAAQESSLREGDQVSVEVESTKVMAGAEPIGTLSRGATFKVEQINGAWVRGTHNLNGQRVSGWVRASDVRKPAPSVPTRPQVSAADRPRDDQNQFQQMQAKHARLISHYSRQFDMPGRLFGTTPIRQGMPDGAPPADMLAALTSSSLYRYASLGLDPATIRIPETEQLLASFTEVPSLEELLKRIETRLQGIHPGSAEEDAAFVLHTRISELRRQGNYTEASRLSSDYLTACSDLFGADAWQTRDAQELRATLERVSNMSSDAQQQLGRADSVSVQYRELLGRMRFHQAMDQARSQLAIRQQILGGKHRETVDASSWITFLERLYAGEGSELHHHQVLSAYTGLVSKTHPAYARCLSNLATVRQDRADFEAADKLLRQALRLRLDSPAITPRFDADIALLLVRLERVFEEQGMLSECQRCASLSRAVTRTLTVSARTAIATTLFDEYAGIGLQETVDTPFYMHGGLAYRPCFAVMAAYGGSPYLIADQVGGTTSSFNELSMSQIDQSKNDGRFPHIPYQQATTAYMQAGDYASAEPFARKGVEVAKAAYANRPEDHFRTAIALQQYAQLLFQIGRSEEGLKIFEEALQLQKGISARELEKVKQSIAARQNTTYEPLSQTHSFISMQIEYAQHLLELKKLDEAEKAAREAVIIAELPTKLLPTPFQHSLAKSSLAQAVLGKVLLAGGKSAEAEVVLRSVLKEDCETWGFSMWNTGRAPDVLAGLADLRLRTGTASPPPEAVAMYSDANNFLNRARLFMQQGGTHEIPLRYSSLLMATNRKAEAAHYLEASLDILDQVRRNAGGDEIALAKFFSQLTKNDPYSPLVQLEVDLGRDAGDTFGNRPHGPIAAFEFLERGRGRALLDLLSRGKVNLEKDLAALQQRHNDPQLSARIAELKNRVATAKSNVAKLTTEMQDFARNLQKIPTGGSQNAAGYIQNLQRQLQQAQAEERDQQQQLVNLARSSREESVPKPMTAIQVSQALQPDELLLAYDVSPQSAVLLVVQPGEKVDGYKLQWPDGKPVREAVLQGTIADFFDEISREDPQDNSSRQAEEIYPPEQLRPTLLPDAVLQLMTRSRRVFIVADGPLHRLPFEALYEKDTGETLLLDRLPAMVYGSSASVLLAKRNLITPVENRPLLVALGDPAFDAHASATPGTASPGTSDADVAPFLLRRSASLQSFGKLPPLPGTRLEIESIVAEIRKRDEHQNAVRILTGSDATVTKLLEASQSPRFLHLATHGLAEGGRRAWESALALAQPTQVTAEDTGFLNLGDLLTGWGGQLQGTDLVVLSACRTARGEFEASEGFIALTWGFLYAGSKNVIASLWEVDDMATALLMTRLYQNHLGTFDQPRVINGLQYQPGTAMTTADALQEAKHWLRTLNRDEALAISQKVRGQEAAVPNRDRPYADPYYWAAFVLYGTNSQ